MDESTLIVPAAGPSRWHLHPDASMRSSAPSPPLHLSPQPCIPRLPVHLRECRRLLRPKAEPHPVKPRQVRGGLRCGNHVVGRDRVLCVRQTDRLHHTSHHLQTNKYTINCTTNLRVQTLAKVLF